jgi:hypothetical protein
MRTHAALATGLALAATLAAPALAAKVNPETAKRAPTQDAGHYLSYPTPTSSWHGCTATARAKSPEYETIQGAPAYRPGTKQSAVTFAFNPAQPYVSWKVKAGYTICGVQVSALIAHPDDDVQHFAEVGYTSSATKGSTAAQGAETVKVKIPKDEPGTILAGQTYAIAKIQDVTVFVRKK